MKVKSFLAIGVCSLIFLGCASSSVRYAKKTELIGAKIPVIVLTDTLGNRISTGVLYNEESASIYIYQKKDEAALPQDDGFFIRMIDVRSKPWYYPMFLYAKKFPREKRLILDGSGGLLDQLTIPPKSMVLKLERGTIRDIQPLR